MELRTRRSCMDGTRIPSLTPQKDVPLSSYTTMRVGGTARFFIEVTSLDELREAVAFAKKEGLPLLVLGGGSNVLIADEGFLGVVLHMCMKGVVFEAQHNGTVLVTAAAGENWDELVAKTTRRGLWGLENLSAIPGTVGAAPVQNIGAYGVEMKDVLAHVEAYDTETGEQKSFTPSECAFGYRDSIFKHKARGRFIITNVAVRLSTGMHLVLSYGDLTRHLQENNLTPNNPRIIRDAIIAVRAKKLPDIAKLGSIGSFFKNPIISKAAYERLAEKYPELPHFAAATDTVKIPLAWLLDHALGLCGMRKGNVGLWEHQPLVIVNYGSATAREIEDFAHEIEKKVRDELGVSVEWEVQKV